jgi:uncharacterized protein (TIGR03435 family)
MGIVRNALSFCQFAVWWETNLAGGYDLQLSFAPERPLPPGAPPADPTQPSIFAALQEQLGLKLDARRGMVDVLVVDRIDPPKEN